MVEYAGQLGYSLGLAMITRAVKSELVHRIRDGLERDLMDKIPQDDPARINLVVIGKYTGERSGIILSVHATHPLGPERGRHDADAQGTPSSLPDRWRLPVESLGGSRYDRLYGTVEVRTLLEGTTPAAAVEIIDDVQTRIHYFLNNDPDLCFFGDEYGYRVFSMETAQEYGYSSGGDNVSVDSHWCDWIARVSYKRSRR